MGIIQDSAPEMWNLVESALVKAMPDERFQKGIDRFHLTERLGESLKALRNPYGRDRDVTLNERRMKFETSDTAIDKIEKLSISSHLRMQEILGIDVGHGFIPCRKRAPSLRFKRG